MRFLRAVPIYRQMIYTLMYQQLAIYKCKLWEVKEIVTVQGHIRVQLHSVDRSTDYGQIYYVIFFAYIYNNTKAFVV